MVPYFFSTDLERDRLLERERERDLERFLFSWISLILRPSRSVSSSLSMAYSMPLRSPNSTMLRIVKRNRKLVHAVSLFAGEKVSNLPFANPGFVGVGVGDLAAGAEVILQVL